MYKSEPEPEPEVNGKLLIYCHLGCRADQLWGSQKGESENQAKESSLRDAEISEGSEVELHISVREVPCYECSLLSAYQGPSLWVLNCILVVVTLFVDLRRLPLCPILNPNPSLRCSPICPVARQASG